MLITLNTIEILLLQFDNPHCLMYTLEEVTAMLIYDGFLDKKAPITNHTVEVVSSDRIICGNTDQMTIRKNGRQDWSLFYIESGCGYFDERAVTAGQIWIYPPAVPQKYVIYGKDQTAYHYLHFTGSDVKEVLRSLGIELQTSITVSGGLISKVVDSIQSSLDDDSPTSKLEAEYHTIYLLCQISKKKKQKSEINMMKRVIDNMEHSFSKEYDAAAFAKMLNVSVSRFNHLFKECVGISPYSFYLNLRIENAVSLLENTNIKIKEIAERCGFEDPLYFTQVFKRIKGATPSEYRKRSQIV